jgi:uncharacterized protein (TIGR03382 family)
MDNKAGGCSSAGGSVTLIALAGLGLLAALRRRRGEVKPRS